MERTALYIRVSTQEQAIHGLSIEAQRANLEEWAKRNRKEVVGIYADGPVKIGLNQQHPTARGALV